MHPEVYNEYQMIAYAKIKCWIWCLISNKVINKCFTPSWAVSGRKNAVFLPSGPNWHWNIKLKGMEPESIFFEIGDLISYFWIIWSSSSEENESNFKRIFWISVLTDSQDSTFKKSSKELRIKTSARKHSPFSKSE